MEAVKTKSGSALQEASNLLNTSVKLNRLFTSEGNCYYELSIGTDPETSFNVSDISLEALLAELPNILSTVIQSQVLIESA
ncbi:MAG: hypothetical protein ACRBF0_23490 [Calditrichia bacterium]